MGSGARDGARARETNVSRKSTSYIPTQPKSAAFSADLDSQTAQISYCCFVVLFVFGFALLGSAVQECLLFLDLCACAEDSDEVSPSSTCFVTV